MNKQDCERFRLLTDFLPFPWQQDLYDRITCQGECGIPRAAAIPTGLGKTNVIAVWLLALASGANVPRRLVYVVNRRTVVDQTTNEAIKLRDNAIKIGIHDLAISTLRGQFADNQEWFANPSRPAIICGTVDMIGSRLLFSGYRIGFKSRPLHAGFLGQDALLVHDEAHLEPAFQRIVEAIEQEQAQDERADKLPWPRIHVMALSATARNGQSIAGRTMNRDLGLTPEEKNLPEQLPSPPTEPIHHVWQRLAATKHLLLMQARDDRKIADEIAELALSRYRDSRQAVLVFLRTVQDVKTVVDKLKKEKQRVQQLTGTLRGLERDGLVEDPVFARFLPPSSRPESVIPADGTAYLVCTSAGEVGVNISADHLVCDLSTLESMIQRFGRVNRFGKRDDTEICVVHPAVFGTKDKNTEYELRRERSLVLLKQLDGNANPVALDNLDAVARQAAFAPEPTILPATDILFDAWSLTTIRGAMPGRPPVGPYLHGLAEWEPPETYVAWREEVGVVTTDLLNDYLPEDLLEAYPLMPHELLRDRSERVFHELQELARKHGDAPVWVLDDDQQVHVTSLAKVADPTVTNTPLKKPLIARIAGCTVLLPPSVGGLSDGSLDAAAEHADDVADRAANEPARRIRLWSDDEDYDAKTTGMRLVRCINPGQRRDSDDESRRTWDWYKERPLEDARTARQAVRLEVHIDDTIRAIDDVLSQMSLPVELAQAIRLAVKLHDQGKRRPQFQFTLGNQSYPDLVLAKSGRAGAKLPEPYRHEFGSLADAMETPEFQRLSPEMQDVVLHLIAAHHGRARPHFPANEAFDPAPGRTQADADRLASEVPRRFARLQRKYGRWGLAYLESLLRAADWAASAEPSVFVTEITRGSR